MKLAAAALTADTDLFRLWLFKRAIAVPADNAPFVMTHTLAGSALIGHVTFGKAIKAATVDANDLFCLTATSPSLFVMPDSQALYGVLTPLFAWTPIANQKLWIELGIKQN